MCMKIAVTKEQQQTWQDPFLYLSQPIYNDIYRHLGCLLCFEEPVPQALRESFEKSAPFPLSHDTIWSDSLLYVGTGNWLEADLRIAYNESICETLRERDCATVCNYLDKRECALDPFDRIDLLFSQFDIQPTPEEKKLFSEDFHNWLLSLHAQVPISFVYTSDKMQTQSFDEWLQRSIQEVPQRLFPRLLSLWNSQELKKNHTDEMLPPIADKASQGMLNIFLEQQTSLPQDVRDALVGVVNAIIGTLEGHHTKIWSEGFLNDLAALEDDNYKRIKTRKIIA